MTDQSRTPRTDAVDCNEANPIVLLARQLELENADLRERLAKAREALVKFVDATESGVPSGIYEMRSAEGRIAFYERISAVRTNALSVLDALKQKGADHE